MFNVVVSFDLCATEILCVLGMIVVRCIGEIAKLLCSTITLHCPGKCGPSVVLCGPSPIAGACCLWRDYCTICILCNDNDNNVLMIIVTKVCNDINEDPHQGIY